MSSSELSKHGVELPPEAEEAIYGKKRAPILNRSRGQVSNLPPYGHPLAPLLVSRFWAKREIPRYARNDSEWQSQFP